MQFRFNRVSFVKLASLVTIVTGAVVLIGWQFDSTVLKSVSDDWVSMKPNTAVALLLAGLSLLFLNFVPTRPRKAFGMGFALAVGLIGVLSLAEYVFGWNPGIDELLFADDLTGGRTSHPGRMSPFSAGAFLALGCSLLLLNRKPEVSQWLAIAVGFISLHALIGYLYGVEEFYGFALLTQIAIHTAGSTLMLSIGVLLARPKTGPARFLTGDSMGANLFRRLWVTTVGLVLLVGFLRLKGEEMGFFTLNFANGLMVLTMILLLSLLLWRIGKRVDAADVVRRQQDRELSNFFENAPFGMDNVSEEGVVLRVNRTECQMLGYSREELVGRNISELHIDKSLAADLLERCRSGEEVRGYEVRLRRKDGSIAQALIDAQIGSEPGQPIRIAKTLQDITARRLAESQLATRQRQQEALATLGNYTASQPNLRAVFDFSINIIAQTLQVEHCKILRLLENKSELLMESGLGWKDGLIGIVTVPNDRGSQAGYTLTVNEPVIVQDLRTETRFKGPPLLVDHAIISGMSVTIPAGADPYGVLAVHTKKLRPFTREDGNFLQAAAHLLGSAIRAERERELRERAGELTELSAELEAEVARRTAELQSTIGFLEGFCYTIAHDLRAPLRSMQGFALALLEDYARNLDDTGKEYAGRIVSSCSRMDRLVLDLLDYGRLSHIELPQAPSDLRSEIHTVLNDLSTEVAASGARVEIEETLPKVMANSTVLRQVLLNLLSNALKFARPGVKPHIRIFAERNNRMVRVTVKDNGIGIEPSFRGKVFRAFERLHTSESYPGTGIGLAIVQKGVERMGGRVGLESEPGKGSCFWFELPSVEDTVEEHQGGHSPERVRDLAGASH